MGCQKKIAKQIIDKEADYILALKDNHKTLHKEVEKFLIIIKA
jgi:predicted transposase YbfD/YdcC